MARVSCQYSISPAPRTTPTAAYTQMDPAIKAASTRAISTAAVMIRIGMLDRRATAAGVWPASTSAASIGDLLGPCPKTAHAPLVRAQRLVEVGSAEIRPQRLRTVKLGVGRLPEQEVAESHLAGRPDDQVRIGEPASVQVTRQAAFVELRQVRPLSRQFVDGIDDLLPAAVIDGDVEDGPPADPGSLIRLAHLFLERGGEVLKPSRESQLDAALRQLIDLAADGLREQVHQGLDLVARSRPVLGRERVERQDPDAALVGRLGDPADGLDPSLVAHDA